METDELRVAKEEIERLRQLIARVSEPCREIVTLIDEHYDDPAYFRYFSLWGSCRKLVAYLDPSIEIKTKVDYPSSSAEETRRPFLVSTESKKA